MQTHKLNCKRCNKEFDSKRSDAKYCSGTCRTLASKVRSLNPKRLLIEYSDAEIESISDRVEISGLSMEEYIKLKSLSDSFKINNDRDAVIALENENKLLKAELYHHRGDKSPGIYLDVNEETIFKIKKSLLRYMQKHKISLEETIIIVSSEFSSIIESMMNSFKVTLSSIEK